jgi:hypothetical protein
MKNLPDPEEFTWRRAARESHARSGAVSGKSLEAKELIFDPQEKETGSAIARDPAATHTCAGQSGRRFHKRLNNYGGY